MNGDSPKRWNHGLHEYICHESWSWGQLSVGFRHEISSSLHSWSGFYFLYVFSDYKKGRRYFVASVSISSFFVCLFWLQKSQAIFRCIHHQHFLFCMSFLTTKEPGDISLHPSPTFSFLYVFSDYKRARRYFVASVTSIYFFVCLFWLQKRGWHFLASVTLIFFFVCLFWLRKRRWHCVAFAVTCPFLYVFSDCKKVIKFCILVLSFCFRHQPTPAGPEPRVCTVGRVQMPSRASRWHAPRCANVGAWGKHAGNPRSCASARHVPWGQPWCTMGKSGRPNILSFAFFFVCLFWLQNKAWHCVAFAVACSLLYVFSDYKRGDDIF